MSIETLEDLQAVADDLRTTASSLHLLLSELVPDSDMMKGVWLKWPQMIRDAANKLDPPAGSLDQPPPLPRAAASEQNTVLEVPEDTKGGPRWLH